MPQVEILPTHTPQLFEVAVTRAAELLSKGEVVALPTETVYGLAADALNSRAIEKIYEVKGRPAHNPIIVHVNGVEMARECAADWPELASELTHAFWPGPLTIILPRAEHIPSVVTAGGETIGLRWPSHPFIQAVIRKCGFPLAAPSANLSNQLSPTNARHVQQQIGDRILLIVDGGQSQVGIESTVIDLCATPPRLLRPGMIHEESLLSVTGSLAQGSGAGSGVLRSPGLLLKHYAPKARLCIMTWADEQDLHHQLQKQLIPQGTTHVIAHTRIPSDSQLAGVSVIPHDVEAFARALYAELHRCDAAGAGTIIVEAVPDSPEWRGVSDRLSRAAAQ